MRLVLLWAIALFFGLTLAVVLAEAARPEVVSVADCLTRSGYSGAVVAGEAASLRGVNAWDGGTLMQAAQRIGAVPVETDTGRRWLWFYALGGNVYVFVEKHADDPGLRLDGEPVGTRHGDCFLRVVNHD